MSTPSERRIVARNRRARHDYEILDTLEAGLVLTGSEIKSVREGKVNLTEAYVRIRGGEAFLVGATIARYDQASIFGHEPDRPRKLLLHRREIEKLRVRIEEKGLTVVPLSLYLVRGWAKVEIAVVRGRHKHDRRQESRRRDEEREAAREAARMRRRG